MLDLARARAETPGCDRVIHFNNAGAALMPAPVLAETVAHLELEAEIGGYEAAAERADALEGVYTSVAALLGCSPREVALTENATRAWDMAFYAFRLGTGDRILTSRAEYASNFIAYLQVSRRTGAVVTPIPDDETGQLDVAALARAVDDRVRLIAITHVPTNGGLVNPAVEVGKVARAAGVPYLLDACQSVGQMPIDVQAIGCDVLTATGRKFLRGPRGTGFLYVSDRSATQLEPPFLDMHAAIWTAPNDYRVRDDARRFETWEANAAGRLGLGRAVEYARSWGLESIRDRVFGLAAALRQRLSETPGVRIRDRGRTQCGIVSFTVDGHDETAIKAALSAWGINVAVSVRSYTLLDMTDRKLDAVVRASVHYYNTEEEIEQFVRAVRVIATSRGADALPATDRSGAPHLHGPARE